MAISHMLDLNSNEGEGQTPPCGSPPLDSQGGHAHETRKKASPITPTTSTTSSSTPTPLKKSKRQAERMARGAFAASRRKEEEEERLYHTQPKKPKLKRRSSENSNTSNSNNKVKRRPSLTDVPISDQASSQEASPVVSPSPNQSSRSSSNSHQSLKQSTTTIPSCSTKKRSKAAASSNSLSGGDTTTRSDGKGSTEKASTTSNHQPSRKRQKLVYKATCDPKRPVYGYALDLVSLVCNNAFSVPKSGHAKKSALGTEKPNNNSSNSNSSKINPTSSTPNNRNNNGRSFRPQHHRVLDRPSSGYTRESEPLKERLMRLQLRQRFASATSMGMSPIEFARKLLKLWGGTLEEVVLETKEKSSASAAARSAKKSPGSEATTTKRVVSSEKNNDCSALKKKKKNNSSSLKKKNNNNVTIDVDKPTTITTLGSNQQERISRPKLEEYIASMSDGLKAAIESYDGGFDKCIGDLEPRSIHPDAQIGNIKGNGNGLLYGSNNFSTNHTFYEPNHPNANTINSNNLQDHTTPTKFDTSIFGESNDRIERSKKLKEKRHRKKLKKAEKLAATTSSCSIDPVTAAVAATTGNGHTTENTIVKEESMSTPAPPSASKRKIKKRTPRKFMDDPTVPVLFRDIRLSHPEDEENLNALHCFVRSKLLEVYVLEGSTSARQDDKTEEATNTVGIRCAWCGPLSRQERGSGHTMSTFFPKSVGEIYRGVCTWQRIHFPVCEHMPEDYRIEYKLRKERDLTRGKKSHWIKSAYDLGIRNVDSERNGLTYKPGSPYNLEEVLKCETDPGTRSNKSRGSDSKRSRSSSQTGRAGHHPGAKIAVPSAFAGGDEFELFGKDFDRDLEESKDAMATAKREEAAF